MRDFLASCENAAGFPMNLVYHESYEHNLRAFTKRLDERESKLFTNDEDASLDLLEYNAQAQKSVLLRVRGVKNLVENFTSTSLTSSIRPDPSIRYAFLHAPNSRERLYASRKMLTYLLTYHQVMPSFLDFVFPFGREEHARDFHFSGFREESRLDTSYRGLAIPELGRSGRELRMCYSLKSVEPSEYQPSMPWSIRQTAVYHSLDLETGNAFWAIVKGDELIKHRIEDAINSPGRKKMSGSDLKFENEFGSSLAVHMIICDWCGGDWRWFISFLEEALQNKTRNTLAVIIDSPVTAASEGRSKAVTWSTISSGKSRMNEKVRSPSIGIKSAVRLPLQPPDQPSGPPPGPPGSTSTNFSPVGSPINPNKFSFADLQHVQILEDRANEVVLILESNINILTELKKHYVSLKHGVNSDKSILGHVDSYRPHIERFDARVTSIINDLRMQQSRTTALLSLLADRKRLLYGILEYQNMEASKALARRAQESTENMELMTKDMHILAQKTKQETVSMRIITLVTLFFLPGTFISVSLLALSTEFNPTIMSTDIVHWQVNSEGGTERVFQPGALQLFLSTCIPIMLVSFAAWYAVYWWSNKQEEIKRRSTMDMIERVYS